MVSKHISDKKTVLLLFSLLVATLAQVKVYSPQILKDEVERQNGENVFNVSLANFGVIQYGHSLIGRIYYDPGNKDGWSPFEGFDYSKDPDDEGHPTPIILVDRGGCTFVKKVRNIQHAGGKLGIVMDNKREDVTTVIMSDDGTGTGIKIPSLLIGKNDGELLKDFFRKHGGYKYMRNDSEDDSEDDKEGKEQNYDKKIIEQAALSVKFKFPHPDNKVEYDIWYSSVEDKALDFIVDFQKYDQLLDQNVVMTPHFVTLDCPYCDTDYIEKDCYGEGKFCAVYQPNMNITGQKIIQEDLRQHCIHELYYKKDKSIFWDYIKNAHADCHGYINKDWSRTAHKKLKIDFDKTQECVKETFQNGDPSDYTDDNLFLRKERAYWMEFGAQFYPSIVINNRTYRGAFEPDSVFNTICAGFKKAPAVCYDSINHKPTITKNMIIYSIIGLIALNVLMILCYRRITKREMKENMRMHVNSAVSQYFAISQRERDQQA